MVVLWIALAGAAGALARYGLVLAISERTTSGFPWGTFAVNVAGSFALGVVFTLTTERFVAHPHLRPALTVGFLGAFTTFSAYALENVRLIEEGSAPLALANIAASTLACLGAAAAGTWLARSL